VKITKQNENKIIVEPIAGKMQTKEEVQLSQLIETSKGQEELHKTIKDVLI
ncbi:16790_t:CDS:2, partial [Cetraspora pellucida]